MVGIASLAVWVREEHFSDVCSYLREMYENLQVRCLEVPSGLARHALLQDLSNHEGLDYYAIVLSGGKSSIAKVREQLEAEHLPGQVLLDDYFCDPRYGRICKES